MVHIYLGETVLPFQQNEDVDRWKVCFGKYQDWIRVTTQTFTVRFYLCIIYNNWVLYLVLIYLPWYLIYLIFRIIFDKLYEIFDDSILWLTNFRLNYSVESERKKGGDLLIIQLREKLLRKDEQYKEYVFQSLIS